MIRFAIDLLWYRYGQIGGAVYVTNNLLDGLLDVGDEFYIDLIITNDNISHFEKYLSDSRFHIITIAGNSNNRTETVYLQNTKLNQVLKKHKIDKCLAIDAIIPFILRGNIKYISVIHDLQAFHYPEYFSKQRNLWFRCVWKTAIEHSTKIIAISNYTKEDILKHYNVPSNKIDVIFDPIKVNKNDVCVFDEVKSKFGIERNEYLYTVSSLAPHKNLKSLLDAMSIIKSKGVKKKLVISGVGGKANQEKFKELVKNMGIEELVVLTGFVDDKVRNTLYKYCEAFLFPSVFEGFGMPPIEASIFGANVITTNKTSLKEVTQGCAYYIDDPFNASEWADAMMKSSQICNSNIDYNVYDPVIIAKQYLEVIRSI